MDVEQYFSASHAQLLNPLTALHFSRTCRRESTARNGFSRGFQFCPICRPRISALELFLFVANFAGSNPFSSISGSPREVPSL